MEHLLLKAAVTAATDKGEFTAVISTATIDREKDIVDPQGFARALKKWESFGKNIPLAWNHSTKAEDQIGYIDPKTVRVQGNEVVASGKIDLDTPNGAHAWRQVKMGTLGFSFGYLVPTGGSTPRKGGGRHIRETDVFEVTATPTPINGDTRVLDYKAVVAGAVEAVGASDDDDATESPLQAIQDAIEELQEFIDGERAEGDDADVATAQRLIAGLQQLARSEAAEPGDDAKSLRQEARDIALAVAAGGVKAAPAPAEQEDMPAGAEWLFPETELKAARVGEIKAVWTTAYVNHLPDSAFLYVEGGGDKDADGKTTPRSLRHFPYKDALGRVDEPHLRNALSRIPQSNLPQDVKDRLTAKAQRTLDAQKSVAAAHEPARPVDPLRKEARDLTMAIVTDGRDDLRQPPRTAQAPTPDPDEVLGWRQSARQEMLSVLSGIQGDNDEPV